MSEVPKIWNTTEMEECYSRTIPSSSRTIDLALPAHELNRCIVELCRNLFTQWSNLDESHFSIEKISGGITNLLLKLSIKETEDVTVCMVVRLFGANTSHVIDRERELHAIPHLSAAGFGAKLLGIFGNGFIQSFINARPLTPSELGTPKLTSMIAKNLRNFHSVEIPGSKEPHLWKDIFKFLRTASSFQYDEKVSLSINEINKEIVELKEVTDCFNSPIVYAHNDLLSGNLMLNDEEDKLYFIDFEYGSYNYRGFDIGNHFNEYGGFECDYTLYPSKEQQYLFFRSYLGYEKSDGDFDSDQELEALYVETNIYMLASHLYWALWALIQAKISTIEFDYLGYFFLRLNQYKKVKENCFSLAHSYLSGFKDNNKDDFQQKSASNDDHFT